MSNFLGKIELYGLRGFGKGASNMANRLLKKKRKNIKRNKNKRKLLKKIEKFRLKHLENPTKAETTFEQILKHNKFEYFFQI